MRPGEAAGLIAFGFMVLFLIAIVALGLLVGSALKGVFA